jgi:hypothetical protein
MVLAGSLTIAATASSPRITKMEEVLWHPGRLEEVNYVTVGAGEQRDIWLTGPWLDYATSVNPISGVSGQIIDKKDIGSLGVVHVRITASTSATRGRKSLWLNITCPFIAFDCVNGPLEFYVWLSATGPLTSITASAVTSSGHVPPMTRVTFTIHGADLAVAELSRWQPDVWEPVIVVRTTTIIFIQATTPACGKPITINLTDKDYDRNDNAFYRRNYYPDLETEPCPRR